MIAIHYQKGNFFCKKWVEYCEKNEIVYKKVCCYDNDILHQLLDCRALFWHVDNYNYRDQLLAKYLVKALENRKILVYPNYNTVWHYDDKVAQKYLLESINAPLVNTYVFYDKKEALAWISNTTFPKVFKLRNGSGSKNVTLVRNKKEASKLIKKAFNKGFPVIDMKSILKERYRKYKLGKENFLGMVKGALRIIIGTPYKNMSSREKGYIYFQDFMHGNKFDLRVITVGNRAFGAKRMVRKNDFRASGSGIVNANKEEMDEECVKIALDISNKMNFQSMAYDFVYDQKSRPKIVEISFAWNPNFDHPGYWDSDLIWHDGNANFEEWMVKNLINKKK